MRMAELEGRSGVHRETIRVYLRHGLLPEPEKPFRNAAIYSDEHLQAIAAVQRLQRENRLTLGQIGEIIRGKTPTVRVEASAFGQLERLVAAQIGYDDHLVSIKAIAKKSPDALADAEAMERLGLITIIRERNDCVLSISDSQMVLIWAEMRAAGFIEALDFVPDMLGFYSEAAEYVAGWEAKTFLERTAGKVGVHTAVNMLEQALPLMLNFFGLLRMKMFMRNINAQQTPSPHNRGRAKTVG